MLAPENASIWVSMGSMFLEMDDLDSATHCLMRAVDIDCANVDAYYNLGLVSAIKGRLEDAAEFFSHALDIRPKDFRALRDSAIVYLTMGRTADAAKRIKKAMQLTDNNPQLKMLERKVRLMQSTERIRDFLCRILP
jgi:Flp pilus assembly protein TadD